MARKTLGRLPAFSTIGKAERDNVVAALKAPLSGYIGGRPSQGYWINRLQDEWSNAFDVSFPVPCNSATTGLTAALMAAGVGPGDVVWVPTYTMSATATAAMLLGAEVEFMDIDPDYFCMAGLFPKPLPKAIIVTNLFGCSGPLPELRKFCDEHQIVLIEDNAQAPFAKVYDGRYTGTIGHMGVFSLNIHKHIQAGEGGVVVTNSAYYNDRLEAAINHGELAGGILGSNFRMTEVTAAIACAQLEKGPRNVQTRIDLAETISHIFSEVPFVIPPKKRTGETHVYYLWAGKIKHPAAQLVRNDYLARLLERRVPFRIGYSPLLHRLFKTDVSLATAEEIEDNQLFTFEICAVDPKAHHLRTMREIILQEAEHMTKVYKENDHDVIQRLLGTFRELPHAH